VAGRGVGDAGSFAALALCVADLESRLTLGGSLLRLTPVAAQAVGMALHELATNAVKHGALAGGAGRIHVAWSVEEQAAQATFCMTWTEQDGPSVVPPQRTGFGRTVVERMIARTLGGTAALELVPTGVVWRFACPADRALESAGA